MTKKSDSVSVVGLRGKQTAPAAPHRCLVQKGPGQMVMGLITNPIKPNKHLVWGATPNCAQGSPLGVHGTTCSARD